MKYFLVISLLVLAGVDATISNTFRQFIRNKFGSTVERRLARDDFANGRGSFGGGNHQAGTKTKSDFLSFQNKYWVYSKTPVILVHGSSTVAAHGLGIAATFKSKGYTDEELYAV